MKDIKDFSLEELKDYFINLEEKPFRAKEIFKAIYKNKTKNFEEITTLPKELRSFLSKNFYIRTFKTVSSIKSRDRTTKFVFALKDKSLIETVLIPSTNKEGKKRNTLCISTEVGCAMKCKFCATGRMGLIRNLTAGEIVEQLLAVEDTEKIQNIVFMGMGEPLLNYDNTKKAIEIISNHYGRDIGRRKITVSTSGIINNIYKLTDQIKSVKLAISLHSANQKKRDILMPGLKNQPISELVKALQYYSKNTGNTLTIEYLLIRDLNDTPQDAKLLIKLAKKIKFVKVNLIHFNKVPFSNFEPSNREEEFLKILLSAGIRTTLRKSKGTEISAACGQLATKTNLSDKFLL